MDSNKLKAIIIVVLALFAALYLGISAATAQLETIAWVVGGLVFAGCIFLGRKIWILIPFLGAMELALRVPGQPTTLLIAQILVLGFSTLLFLMRKLPFKLMFTELEWWLIIFSLVVVQVYLRNPVGLNIFGGGTVGGRPYVIFAISVVVAFIFCGLRVTPKDLKSIVPWTIFGGLINIGTTALGFLFPIIPYMTGADFTNAGEANYENRDDYDSSRAGRINSLPAAMKNMSLWLASFISPLRALFHPLWCPILVISLIGAAYSGYRTTVMTVGLTYIVGVAYRGGFISLALSAIGGVAAVALLAIVNLMFPLPPNLQRSFSFLPGTWEEQYVTDASGSTDWRLEIWEDALLSDRWIKNKLLGDGLGFSAAELAAQMTARKGVRSGVAGLDAHRESIMANGDYHSTLVSTIRTCGYLGAVLLVIATFRLAVHAHRLVKKYKNTEYEVLCLLQGIPLVAAPVWVFLSASSFGQSMSALILGIGMVRLLENNLPKNMQVGQPLVRGELPH